MATQSLRSLSQNIPTDPQERHELYLAARDVMLQTESLWETQDRLLFPMHSSAAIRVAMDLGIYRHLNSEPKRAWTVQELAQKAKADPEFMGRMLRALCAYGTISQTSATTFEASNITRNLAIDSAEKTALAQVDLVGPCLHALPEFLAKRGYKNPDDHEHSAFQAGWQTESSLMDWFQASPHWAKIIFEYMPVQREGQISWLDKPEFRLQDFQMSEHDLKNDRALMVDVGGGAGHQCIGLRQKRPHLKGRVVLEDVDMMISQATQNPKLKELDIEVLTHDFLTPQPSTTRGAKVFYIRNVLHDWADDKDRVILTQLRDALAEDSVIVIDELVVPEMGANSRLANFDMTMMAFVAALERTLPQWTALLGSVGLKIWDVWRYDAETGDSLIVVVKA